MLKSGWQRATNSHCDACLKEFVQEQLARIEQFEAHRQRVYLEQVREQQARQLHKWPVDDGRRQPLLYDAQATRASLLKYEERFRRRSVGMDVEPKEKQQD